MRGEGVWGRIREYKEFGEVWRSMDGGVIGKFLVVWGVGSSMGRIWKEWGSVKGDVEKCVGVWRSVGGGNERCGEGEGNVEGGVGKNE